MMETPSRASPQGGQWKTAIIPINPNLDPEDVSLEFYVVNGITEQKDRGPRKTSYVCPQPGGYKLQAGQLRPFTRAMQPPVMLVSRLMVIHFGSCVFKGPSVACMWHTII